MLIKTESHSTVKPEDLDFALVGFNVRSTRMASNLTQNQLAELASAHRTTVCRIEQGKPIHFSNLQSICRALGRPVEWFNSTGHYMTPRQVYINRRNERQWITLIDVRKHVPPDNVELIQDENERLRLGHTGFVPVFHSLAFAMPNGPGITYAEIYQPILFRPSTTYKDCAIYCIRGDIRVTVAGETYELSEGDVIGYPAHLEALHEPIKDVGPNDLPPLTMYIGANRIGRLPGELKRRRIRKPNKPK